jgi:hypothetical protein
VPKTMPNDTWNNLFYPPADYEHFENSGQFDFEANATAFSWKNASWLADAALLAHVRDCRHRTTLALSFSSSSSRTPGILWSTDNLLRRRTLWRVLRINWPAVQDQK